MSVHNKLLIDKNLCDLARRPGIETDPTTYILEMYHILPSQNSSRYLFELYRLLKIHDMYYATEGEVKSWRQTQFSTEVPPLLIPLEKESNVPYEFVREWMLRRQKLDNLERQWSKVVNTPQMSSDGTYQDLSLPIKSPVLDETDLSLSIFNPEIQYFFSLDEEQKLYKIKKMRNYQYMYYN